MKIPRLTTSPIIFFIELGSFSPFNDLTSPNIETIPLVIINTPIKFEMVSELLKFINELSIIATKNKANSSIAQIKLTLECLLVLFIDSWNLNFYGR